MMVYPYGGFGPKVTPPPVDPTPRAMPDLTARPSWATSYTNGGSLPKFTMGEMGYGPSAPPVSVPPRPVPPMSSMGYGPSAPPKATFPSGMARDPLSFQKFLSNPAAGAPTSPKPFRMGSMTGGYVPPVGDVPASGAIQDLKAIAAPFGKAGSVLGSFGNYLAPVVNNPLTRTVARVAGPVGAAIGAYSAGSELLDPSSAPRQRFAAAVSDASSGNYGSAAKNAYYGVGDVVGSATGLKPFAQYLAGKANPITIDADGNFSRAPTNMAEYKQMMALKDAAQKPAAAPAQTYNEDVFAPKPEPAAPAQSYNDWLMKQPVSKLNAADYAARANLEIEKRAPELLQQNIMKAASYDLAHPDHVTSETHHKDGSWGKTYGDRGATAMSGYSSFRNALANEGYKDALAQSSMIKANNSDKFDAGDKLNMVDAAQKRVTDALLGDNSVSPQVRLQRARAYFPTFQAALKANGMEPPDFDTFLQEQFGVTKNANGGFYNVPK